MIQRFYIVTASAQWTPLSPQIDAQFWKMKIFSQQRKEEWLVFYQHPQPVQFVSNLFLPGGFELARYSDSKVREGEFKVNLFETLKKWWKNFDRCVHLNVLDHFEEKRINCLFLKRNQNVARDIEYPQLWENISLDYLADYQYAI